jgi:hypothetical protein
MYPEAQVVQLVPDEEAVHPATQFVHTAQDPSLRTTCVEAELETHELHVTPDVPYVQDPDAQYESHS